MITFVKRFLDTGIGLFTLLLNLNHKKNLIQNPVVTVSVSVYSNTAYGGQFGFT